jgi:glycosyltransferase involved in cell wall biosynthesis
VTGRPLTYAVVTPVRNEEANLGRLAASLASQEIPPLEWVIVDTGSSDSTTALAETFAREHAWTRLTRAPADERQARGAPVVRGLTHGLEALAASPDVIVKVDADVELDPTYFRRLLDAFAADASLGMASGSCWEQRDGEWTQRHVTGTTVWGAARAYRAACLEDVLPLEERMGWDGVDEFKANVRGWQTGTLAELPFRHHRREGERDGASRRARAAQGAAAWYLGYRSWYLVLRALHHARHDRGSLAMIAGYVAAAIRREERCTDPAVRRYVRSQQHPRRLPLRVLEALGRRGRLVEQ